MDLKTSISPFCDERPGQGWLEGKKAELYFNLSCKMTFSSLSNDVKRSEAILFTNYRSPPGLPRAEEGRQLLGRLERIGLKTGGIGGMLGPQCYCPHAPIPNCFSDCHTTEA